MVGTSSRKEYSLTIIQIEKGTEFLVNSEFDGREDENHWTVESRRCVIEELSHCMMTRVLFEYCVGTRLEVSTMEMCLVSLRRPHLRQLRYLNSLAKSQKTSSVIFPLLGLSNGCQHDNDVHIGARPRIYTHSWGLRRAQLL